MLYQIIAVIRLWESGSARPVFSPSLRCLWAPLNLIDFILLHLRLFKKRRKIQVSPFLFSFSQKYVVSIWDMQDILCHSALQNVAALWFWVNLIRQDNARSIVWPPRAYNDRNLINKWVLLPLVMFTFKHQCTQLWYNTRFCGEQSNGS